MRSADDASFGKPTMIHCVDRKKVFSRNPFLASLIRGVQEAQFCVPNDADETERRDIEEWRVQVCDEFVVPTQTWCGHIQLERKCARIEDFPADLSAILTLLFKALNVPSLCFLPSLRSPWLDSSSDYPPVVAAQKKLRSLVPTNSFDGGLMVDAASLSEVIPIIFWIARCCGSFPEIYAGAADYPGVFTLCKYGTLHAEMYNDDAFSNLKRSANGVGLHEVLSCNEQFSETGAIDGRILRLD